MAITALVALTSHSWPLDTGQLPGVMHPAGYCVLTEPAPNPCGGHPNVRIAGEASRGITARGDHTPPARSTHRSATSHPDAPMGNCNHNIDRHRTRLASVRYRRPNAPLSSAPTSVIAAGPVIRRVLFLHSAVSISAYSRRYVPARVMCSSVMCPPKLQLATWAPNHYCHQHASCLRGGRLCLCLVSDSVAQAPMPRVCPSLSLAVAPSAAVAADTHAD